jgi:hypothetical protein
LHHKDAKDAKKDKLATLSQRKAIKNAKISICSLEGRVGERFCILQ